MGFLVWFVQKKYRKLEKGKFGKEVIDGGGMESHQQPSAFPRLGGDG